MELLNFIGGQFVPAGSGKTFNKISPFDGLIISKVAHSDPMDVVRALQNAKKAASSMKDLSLEQRAELLQNMWKSLDEQKEDFAMAEALHQGLSASFVLEKSIQPILKLLHSTIQSLRTELPSGILLQPTGVIGIITSWNLSFRLVMQSLVPALAAGNTVLVKVSEHSPITGQLLADLCVKAGIPAGAVNILQGYSDIGEMIAAHPGIQAIAAASSSETMSAIAKAGTNTFKKLQLVGSSKNPLLILSDADFQSKLSQILESVLIGQGQLCWNTSRIFVLESVLPDFLEALKTYIESLKPLQSPMGNSPWTPLISQAALSAIEVKISEGLKEQGKMIVGNQGDSTSGFYMKPTFMLDLSNCSVLQQDELHGPLCLISPVKYQHEMVKWANNTYLGHSAVIWGSAEKIIKVAQQLDYAAISANEWMPSQQGRIFGLKQSSFGSDDMSWAGSFYSNVRKLTAP